MARKSTKTVAALALALVPVGGKTFLSGKDARRLGREAAKGHGHSLGLFVATSEFAWRAESKDGAFLVVDRKARTATGTALVGEPAPVEAKVRTAPAKARKATKAPAKASGRKASRRPDDNGVAAASVL